MNAIAAQAIRTLCHATHQEIANTAWALARLDYLDLPLFDAISAASIAQIFEVDPQSRANLVWAWAHL